ncbi:hypothetical protein AB1399_04660, partial [Hydrogenibacillus schlegelii]|uniref:hypothetical protein n=1 Tax=Hydrogenibacillus schlegelii TaxID=1484 RepID=UPI0034A058F1
MRPPVAGRAGTPARSGAARRRAAWRGSKRQEDEGRFLGEINLRAPDAAGTMGSEGRRSASGGRRIGRRSLGRLPSARRHGKGRTMATVLVVDDDPNIRAMLLR